ncbi:MAG: alpha/beta hydrolase [Myxococcota bacterium]
MDAAQAQEISSSDPVGRYERALSALFARLGVSPARRRLDDEGDAPLHQLELGAEHDGPPLVCVHGGMSDAASLVSLLALLPGRRILAADRPGHGLSHGIDYGLVPDFRAHAAEHVGRVVGHSGAERVDLLGNSMGGFFACAYALAHPERVRRLILLGAPAGVVRWIPWFLRLMGTAPLNRLLARRGEPTLDGVRSVHRRILVANADRPLDEYYATQAAGAALPGHSLAARTMLECALDLGGWRGRYDIRPALAASPLPTLFLWGDRDAFAPADSGRDLAARMPNAELVELEDAGHLPWLDQPEQAAESIARFLERPDPH